MADKQLGSIHGLVSSEGNNRGGALTGNLLTKNQSSLETDTTGWAADTNCTIARTTDQEKFGAASLALTSAAAGDMDAQTPTGTSGVPVVASRQYTALAWFRTASVAQACRVDIFWWKSDGAASAVRASDSGLTVNDASTGWNMAFVTADAPSDAAFATVKVVVLSADGASEVHYVDGISLHEGDNLNWVEGGTERVGYFDDDLTTIASMRQRLKEIDSTYYSDERLNTMTMNDMVYAIRVEDATHLIKA